MTTFQKPVHRQTPAPRPPAPVSEKVIGGAGETRTSIGRKPVNPRAIVGGLWVAFLLLFVVWVVVILFSGSRGGRDNRVSCEAARQEAARRVGSGTLTEGAVDRLANCKP